MTEPRPYTARLNCEVQSVCTWISETCQAGIPPISRDLWLLSTLHAIHKIGFVNIRKKENKWSLTFNIKCLNKAWQAHLVASLLKCCQQIIILPSFVTLTYRPVAFRIQTNLGHLIFIEWNLSKFLSSLINFIVSFILKSSNTQQN